LGEGKRQSIKIKTKKKSQRGTITTAPKWTGGELASKKKKRRYCERPKKERQKLKYAAPMDRWAEEKEMWRDGR